MTSTSEHAALQAVDDRIAELFTTGYAPQGLAVIDSSAFAPHILLLAGDDTSRRVEIVHHVDLEHRDQQAMWFLNPWLGWYHDGIERVRNEATGRDDWASIMAPLSAFRGEGTLRAADDWRTASADTAHVLVDSIVELTATALPQWLTHFGTVDGTLEYAKQWPVLRDVHHQETGLILACLEQRDDDIAYFGQFVFRRTARVMLRRGTYDQKAADYRTIGKVTGVDVPVPTREEVQVWADEQARTAKY